MDSNLELDARMSEITELFEQSRGAVATYENLRTRIREACEEHHQAWYDMLVERLADRNLGVCEFCYAARPLSELTLAYAPGLTIGTICTVCKNHQQQEHPYLFVDSDTYLVEMGVDGYYPLELREGKLMFFQRKKWQPVSDRVIIRKMSENCDNFPRGAEEVCGMPPRIKFFRRMDPKEDVLKTFPDTTSQ